MKNNCYLIILNTKRKNNRWKYENETLTQIDNHLKKLSFKFTPKIVYFSNLLNVARNLTMATSTFGSLILNLYKWVNIYQFGEASH